MYSAVSIVSVFRMTANNFNQPMAKAAKITIAEVEEIVEVGEIPPDQVMEVPGLMSILGV